jgi:hypothetical protein
MSKIVISNSSNINVKNDFSKSNDLLCSVKNPLYSAFQEEILYLDSVDAGLCINCHTTTNIHDHISRSQIDNFLLWIKDYFIVDTIFIGPYCFRNI